MAKCQHCGASIVKGDQYCAGCGRPIEKSVYPAPLKAEPNEQVSEKETGLEDPNKATTAVPLQMSIKKLLWFAAFVLLIGISLFYFMKQESGRDFYASLFKHNSYPLLEGFFSEPIILADYRFNDGAPKILYTEDFNSGSITNWDIWIDHPTSANPGWLVTKTGDNYCFEGKGHAFARPNPARRGLTDFSISFRLYITENSSSGVPFNFSFREFFDPGHKRYFLGIGRSGISLIKQSTQSHSTLSDKDFKTLKRANHSINPNRWYDIKVSVRENNIKVYIDDKLVIEHTDEEAPYLEGGVAFETLDYGHVLIDDIKITAEHLTETEVLLAEEEQIFIDPLQATVKALRFYEGDENGSSSSDKGYTNKYYAEETRFIYWELFMVFVPGRKTDFEIRVEYFDPQGELLHSEIVEGFYIENDWTESIHAAGFGFETPGIWKPGIYKVRLYVEDLQIAEGRFLIQAQDDPTAETDQAAEDLTYINVIDHEFGNLSISELPLGAEVTDLSWQWEYRTGFGYTPGLENVSKPVTWIIVAKDHYEMEEPHVTLLAKEIIAKYCFDNSSNRWSQNGSNHWGKSGSSNATMGLRPWLNSSDPHSSEGFYVAFSGSFKQAIINTALPNREWNTGKSYVTDDLVFIPSITEIGDTRDSRSKLTHQIGTVYPFFAGAVNQDRQAALANGHYMYWTRSPVSFFGDRLHYLFYGNDSEYLFADRLHVGVRPAINVKADTMVYQVRQHGGN